MRISVSIAHIELDEYGFCRITFDTKKNDTLDVVSAEEVVEAVHLLCSGMPHPIMVDSRGASGLVTPKAREFFKSSPKMIEAKKAEAFIVNTLANKVLVNLYLKMAKPTVSTRIFANEEDAVEWLKKFL